MELTLKGYVAVRKDATVRDAVTRMLDLLRLRKEKPHFLALGPLTFERLKADLCPSAKHLSDIHTISVEGVPVMGLLNSSWDAEGKVWYT